jgi:hypothetical protein
MQAGRIAPCTAAILAAAFALAPRTAHADEPVAPDTHDPSVYPPPAARFNLVLGGIATWAVWYGGAYGAATLFPDAPGAPQLKIPVAGPWMAFTHTGCSRLDPNCSTLTIVLREVLTGIDGVGQAGGVLVALVEAPLLTTQVHEAPKPRAALGATWEPGPIVVSDKGAWFSVVGRF